MADRIFAGRSISPDGIIMKATKATIIEFHRLLFGYLINPETIKKRIKKIYGVESIKDMEETDLKRLNETILLVAPFDRETDTV